MAQPATAYRHFTWEDYRSWPEDERWELVAGDPVAMSPSPGFRHQAVTVALTVALGAFLKGHRCRVLAAPMDVRLSDVDVVQPDVLVVCDPRKIRETHIEGAPDLVIEVASPTTTVYDRTLKLELYARYGVREYWLVTPYPHLAEVLLLDGDSYRVHRTYRRQDTLTSPTLTGLALSLSGVFDFPIPEEDRIEEVHEEPPPYSRLPPPVGSRAPSAC
jgi:Uma2 family endonuclease